MNASTTTPFVFVDEFADMRESFATSYRRLVADNITDLSYEQDLAWWQLFHLFALVQSREGLITVLEHSSTQRPRRLPILGVETGFANKLEITHSAGCHLKWTDTKGNIAHTFFAFMGVKVGVNGRIVRITYNGGMDAATKKTITGYTLVFDFHGEL